MRCKNSADTPQKPAVQTPPASWRGESLVINVRVQPKAGVDRIIGLHGEFLKVAIKAPPVGGKANVYLLQYIAKTFGVPRTDVEILSGTESRNKRVLVRSPSRIPDAIKLSAKL